MDREHFVYVYRDQNGNPVYFGQGKLAARAGSHRSRTHNTKLKALLDAQGSAMSLEVIGPLGSKPLADAIETALISACKPAKALCDLCNEHKGPTIFRFRRFGVPDRYASRTTQLLELGELKKLARSRGPLMFVRINQKDIVADDPRRGYDLSSPPHDDEIRRRIEAWWQVAGRVDGWAADNTQSPAILIGVTGAPGSQMVIASAAVDRRAWRRTEVARGGLMKIPLKSKSLDEANLRGRPISPETGLRFNAFRQAQFQILNRSGFEPKKARSERVR